MLNDLDSQIPEAAQTDTSPARCPPKAKSAAEDPSAASLSKKQATGSADGQQAKCAASLGKFLPGTGYYVIICT